MSTSNSERLKRKAKKEAVNVGGFGGNPLISNTAKLPESLYCFTENELEEYKRTVIREANGSRED